MNKTIKRVMFALFAALFMLMLDVSNVAINFANIVDDALYQKPSVPDERIVIIGIDSKALDEFGAWPWDRSLMAEAINYLNADPENKPAVIGVDVVYDAVDNPESDALLVSAVENAGNVVLSSYASFGSSVITMTDGSFYVDSNAALYLVEPYESLLAVSDVGHVNAMRDTDGILRHAIWEIDMISGETIPAFNKVIVEKYCEASGLNSPETPPLDARNRWYVVQQSLPGAYSDGISIADLINHNVDTQFFADKIVLIGPYDTSFKDEYLTAIDHAQNMAGVEYQANVIGALLQGNTKEQIASLDEALLFIISFMVFLILPSIGLVKATITAIVLTTSWILICNTAFNNGVKMTAFYIPLAIALAYLYAIITNYFSEYAKRNYVATTFRRYVAPEIVSELLKGDPKTLKLGGDAVDVAVLFVDIRGFTALSSKMSPTLIVEILNSILTLTTDCILNNKGTLDKYMGDCTMAFWGAPLAQEDCVYKAVKAAHEMQVRMSVLSKELEAKYGHQVSFGVGVNYGSAIVGNIGADTRMDYTIIGDVVNTASRLESNAVGGEILISESVAERLSGRAKLEDLGSSIKLKGKSDNFRIYKVLDIT